MPFHRLSHPLGSGASDPRIANFDDDLKGRRSPRIETVLAAAPASEQGPLFAGLLAVELWWRKVRGEYFSPAAYLARFPDRGPAIREAFRKIPRGVSVVLDVTLGPDEGDALELSGHHTLVIGRAADAECSLVDDPRISRFHCRLEVNPPSARIVDLGSRNGTFVNDERIDERDLLNGDSLRIGGTRFQVRIIDTSSFDADVAESTIHSPPQHADDPPPIEDFIAFEVPGYELLDEIGRGGLGAVYRARQIATGTVVAIKYILPGHTPTWEASRLFLREGTILSQLRHPRIVRFLDMGLAQDNLYLVMEYVSHVSHGELVAPMRPERRWQTSCGIVSRVLDALEFAHGRNFVHRDVKPANILLGRRTDGRLDVKLADFGLAKNYLMAGLSGLTHDGSARGSIAFMPPEQVSDCCTAKPTSDLYSVGVTLFRYLTGAFPFEFHSQGTALRAILEDTPLRADALMPDLPRDLADLIDRMLAKDPAARLQTAAAFRDALQPFAAFHRNR